MWCSELRICDSGQLQRKNQIKKRSAQVNFVFAETMDPGRLWLRNQLSVKDQHRGGKIYRKLFPTDQHVDVLVQREREKAMVCAGNVRDSRRTGWEGVNRLWT